MEHSLAGWSVERFNQVAWAPWGGSGETPAKGAGNSDGYFLTLIEAEAGYRGDPHEHVYPEFLYVIDGSVRTQGQTMKRGDGYAAAAGSSHTDFATDSGATYVLLFKL